MSLKIPNIGDKVYCIKTVYNSFDVLLAKENNEYIIINTHDGAGSEGSILTVHISDIYNKKFLIFFISTKSTIYNYHDYFCDIKEHRKMKLLNIIKNVKQMITTIG